VYLHPQAWSNERNGFFMNGRRIVLLLLIAAVGTSHGAAAETTADLTMKFTKPAVAQVVNEQKWTGDDAAKFRKSLDVLLGDGDGQLTDAEARNILQAAKKDMEGKRASMFWLNGKSGTVAPGVVVEADGLLGPTTSTANLVLRHRFELRFNETQGDELKFNATLVRGGAVVLTPPEGYGVTEISGIPGANVASDGRTAAGGPAPTNAVVYVTMRKAGNGDGETPEEAGGGGGGSPVPGPGLALVAAALAAALIVRALHRKR
jgi:hypothetical protein